MDKRLMKIDIAEREKVSYSVEDEDGSKVEGKSYLLRRLL